ncbi:zinc finger and BTB domain-containing protein 17-like isoform X1 [Venturia canescens]|uniref:zinc finger and BTB domain-containing protein 17-like isoform X1 n=1 Tax=Venturia canescens TaxID=32260 RepID=UPI001C9C3D7E|nr:zinc finger and BTB domain-containing protein 17-like isoform X1 [Venturia canescens]
MASEQFSLVWNSFPTNLSSGLYTLLTDEHLVDVTLTAEGQILRAHKLILSVCSSYFRELFEENTCKHPIVILKDVNYRDLSAMLHFMYQGEVNIKQEDISSFLKLAETLQIKGLTTENRTESYISGETKKEKDSFRTEMCEDLAEQNLEETVSQRLEGSVGSPHRERSPSTRTKQSCIKVTSSKVFQRFGGDLDTEKVMQPINRMFHENYEDRTNEMKTEQMTAMSEEPLDYTSEVRAPMDDGEEPLNYRLNANDHPPQDFGLILPHAENCERESLGTENQPQESKDLNCEEASFSRGKKPVKGLPSDSLPLETTLRVVSEIGPTLRVDRGKVVRMYSCPWCLRHFTRKENLKLHVRYIHGPLESLTCKLCGNKYKNSNSLRVHSYLYHNTRRSKHTKP